MCKHCKNKNYEGQMLIKSAHIKSFFIMTILHILE